MLKGFNFTKEIQEKRIKTRRKNGWFKNPEETSKKKSNALKGKVRSEIAKKNISESQKGKKLSETHIKKRTETRRRNGWYKNPEETSRRKSKALTGKIRSEITRKNMSKALKGMTAWNKGLTKETNDSLKKLSETNRKEKNPNWKGGLSFEFYPPDWVDTLRESIRQRDKYICQLCGIHQDELIGWTKKLDIHHKDYCKNNLNPNDLISLCRSCHTKTNSNRKYWINYFQEEINYGKL